MSKLETLIQQLCPDGVEFKTIKEVYTRLRGTSITASEMKDIASKDGEIRIFAGGKTIVDAHEEDIPNANIIKVPAVLVQSRGVIDVIYYERPFTFKNEMWAYTHKEKDSVKYLYYVLKNNVGTFRKTASGMGSLPQISLKVTEDFKIPVPPLEIQREIVRILDNFTELTEKLIAELTARKKQFQFYHKQFFEFKKSDCIQIVCIKDICELLTGYPFDSSQFTATGIHLLRGMNIKRGILDYSESNNRYWNSVQGYEKFLLSTDDIVIAMDGSLVGKSYAQVKSNHLPSLLVQRVTRVRVTKANAHYIYHYISSGAFTRYVEKKKTGGAVPHISLKDIANFKIPLPSENMQKEIADSLDRFDALCNDLTSGLPAEIAARQKQYEYYRDKLLTFKKRS